MIIDKISFTVVKKKRKKKCSAEANVRPPQSETNHVSMYEIFSTAPEDCGYPHH